MVVSRYCSVRLRRSRHSRPVAGESRGHVFVGGAGCCALRVELRIILVGQNQRAFEGARARACTHPGLVTELNRKGR